MLFSGDLAGQVAGGQLYCIQPYHLGSPWLVVDPQRDVAIWRWDLRGEAFGSDAPAEESDQDGVALRFDLRFPGQRHDPVSGLNYNYFRDYEPATGRYLQSDPIGLEGEWSTYAYVGGNSLSSVDLWGLKGCLCGSASFSQIRGSLPSKGVFRQARDGVGSYIDGVAWGGTALAARAGLLGDGMMQEAIDMDGQLVEAGKHMWSNSGRTAAAVAAVASKCPVQTVIRAGSGLPVGAGFKSSCLTFLASSMAAYGSTFKVANQDYEFTAAGVIVGEELCP
jgi:RHS repeat-associated protein